MKRGISLMVKMFDTFESAAGALLLTTCKILRSSNVDFVVVGGWSPYLRKGAQGLTHPGTRDVDVLFADKDAAVVHAAIEKMLNNGVTSSAKHEFQMLRSIGVGETQFIFNVDFLHPSEQSKNPDLLSDIFDLGVPDSSDPTGKRWVKSIVFQSAKIVFERGLFSPLLYSGKDVHGDLLNENVPLLNEAGLVLSKFNSVKQLKRPRDAFDIFYTLTDENGEAAARVIKELAIEIDEVGGQLEGFQRWLADKHYVFKENVCRYGAPRTASPSSLIAAMLRREQAK